MNTTKMSFAKPIALKIKGQMHKPMHLVTPLWKKRVLKRQAWFLRKNRILER